MDRGARWNWSSWRTTCIPPRDLGYAGSPFRWDVERRFLLRRELDALYFRLYGLDRDDLSYIMETFPIVKRDDEKRYGRYRTRDVILSAYDAMVAAARDGLPYATLVDPPPGDPRAAHPLLDAVP